MKDSIIKTLSLVRVIETEGIYKGLNKTEVYMDGKLFTSFPPNQKQPRKNCKKITINCFIYNVNWLPDFEYKQINFTRVNSDTNGNSRYVCHFLNLMSEQEKGNMRINPMRACWYEGAIKRAKQLGGRKFHNKQYGGGIVFQETNPKQLEQEINQLMKLLGE